MISLPEKWFPEHNQQGEIKPLAQAKLYPYPAPYSDFWMREGRVHLAPEGIKANDLKGLVPVLSIGSNRAPLQLRRKFGPDATLPVTAACLKGCDIVYAATMSFYCAVPATLCPSDNTDAHLNIAWLTRDQLLFMHETEALGVAYDFIKFDDGMIDHGKRDDGNDDIFKDSVYGYQSRAGLLNFNGSPLAQQGIKADKRRFSSRLQEEVLSWVKDNCGDQAQSLDDWLSSLRDENVLRYDVINMLADKALPCPQGGWSVEPARAISPENYL